MRLALLRYVLLFALLPALPLPLSAQTNAVPSPQLPPPILDNDEMAHLVKVRQQVLGANPDLQAEEEKLKALHDSAQNQSPAPTAEQRNAAFTEWKAYQKKMRTTMLKIDPTLQPLFDKLDNARKHGAATPFQPASAK